MGLFCAHIFAHFAWQYIISMPWEIQLNQFPWKWLFISSKSRKTHFVRKNWLSYFWNAHKPRFRYLIKTNKVYILLYISRAIEIFNRKYFSESWIKIEIRQRIISQSILFVNRKIKTVFSSFLTHSVAVLEIMQRGGTSLGRLFIFCLLELSKLIDDY